MPFWYVISFWDRVEILSHECRFIIIYNNYQEMCHEMMWSRELVCYTRFLVGFSIFQLITACNWSNVFVHFCFIDTLFPTACHQLMQLLFSNTTSQAFISNVLELWYEYWCCNDSKYLKNITHTNVHMYLHIDLWKSCQKLGQSSYLLLIATENKFKCKNVNW